MAITEVSTPSSTSLADVGLLILRVGVGATMLQAGLRKVFDFSPAVNFMESGGWRLPKFAAVMVTWILLNGTNPIHFTAPAV